MQVVSDGKGTETPSRNWQGEIATMDVEWKAWCVGCYHLGREWGNQTTCPICLDLQKDILEGYLRN